MEWLSQFKPLYGTPIDRLHPLANGLVASYLFNECTGKIVNDSSGNGNNGLCIGMADPPTPISGWVPGPHGAALAFDGGNDYVDCGGNITFPGNSFTVIAMLNTAQIGSTRFYFSRSDGITSSGSKGVVLYLGSTGSKWTFGVWDGSHNATPADTDNAVAGVNYNVAGVWDSVSKSAKLYVQGLLKTTVVSASMGDFNYATNLLIGRGFTTYLSGLISSVSIYNRALSAQEIAYLYAFPYCMYDTGIDTWEYYRFISNVFSTSTIHAMKGQTKISAVNGKRKISSLSGTTKISARVN